MKAKKVLAPVAVAVIVGSFTGQASAVMIDLNSEAGWQPNSDNPDVVEFRTGTETTVDGDAAFEGIDWIQGTSPQSMLDISATGGPFVLDTDTNTSLATSVHIGLITQTNVEIPTGTTFDVDLLAFVNASLNGSTDDQNFEFRVSFLETDNGTPCNQAGPGGFGPSENLVGTTCDDIYSFDTLLGGNLMVMDDDFIYDIALGLVPGAGVQIGDDGRIYTGEFDTTSIGVVAFLAGSTAKPMPEPSSLALIGLGLAGIGAAARRRAKKSRS